MHIVILAGGQGRRLQPYTTILPKPLMPIGNKPILEILIRQLCEHGFTQITMAVGYLSELIQAYFGDGSNFGVSIDYQKEKSPLGTAGPLKLIANKIEDDVLCINGDILTDIDFSALLRQHENNGCLATIGTHERQVDIDFGVVHIDKNEQLSSWDEKPRIRYLVSMGVYLLRKEALSFIPPDEPMDMPNLLMKLKEAGSVSTYKHSGYWLDIGRPEDHQAANNSKFAELE